MRKGSSAMSVTMIGLDTAKAVFHVHGINEAGKALVRRKLRRNEVIGFFEAQPTCMVVLEACGAAHHWGRVLTGLGHTVKLIAPEAVRPFVKRGRKNDAADAAALCEAARRPEVKFVPVKGLEQQAMLALHAARALLVKQQTMLANALRSLVAEFGVVVPLGSGKLGDLVAQVEASLPGAARQALSVLQRQFHAARSAAAELEAAVVAHAREDGTARRLATIPGVGPITASLIAATVVDVSLFKSARYFAAWLGLVPRQHTTGGKPRLGRITKDRQRADPHALGARCYLDGAPRRAMEQRSRRLGQRRPRPSAGTTGHCSTGQQDGAHHLGLDGSQGGLSFVQASSGCGGMNGMFAIAHHSSERELG
jgi:error-prone DNA polymerase